MKRSGVLGKLGHLAGVVALSLIMLVPLYLLVINSFKSDAEIRLSAFALPGDFTFDYIVGAATDPKFNMLKAYAVTLFLVVVVNILSILVTGPAAYAIARGRGMAYRAIMLLLLGALFIPGQVTLIPLIYVLRTLGLMHTLPGLFLTSTGATIPTTVFLFSAYIKSIPRDLDESAKLDGAGRYRTFWQIIFPIMKPAVATAMVLNVVGIWVDFLGPRIILGPGSNVRTVTTGVYAYITKYDTDFSKVYPTMLLAVAPVLIFYVLLQKRIIGGLAAGAIKG
ncbi:MAG: carbohydrate ABC transporter permease [Bifidobacteriaceae bacterium]|jgi:raffinose/stachyose/melibiose transport system permease protein|nr:carbohydrate ABC transporter permease [Bifidobacteriaceae bacterium]